VGSDPVSAVELWIAARGILSRRSSVAADVSLDFGKTPRYLLTRKSLPDVGDMGLKRKPTIVGFSIVHRVMMININYETRFRICFSSCPYLL
jgi:hypothetical protein